MPRACVVLAASLLACCSGGLDGQPPNPPPLVRGQDGHSHYVVQRGAYRAFYDTMGRLDRLEFDINKDGKPDHIAHYGGKRHPYLIEVDEDFDGNIDRWEYYDDERVLVRVGVSRRGHGPDMWSIPGPGGAPKRLEYDEDGDGKVDRTEELDAQGRVVRVALDTGRKGRMDRWQTWQNGRLQSEELDIDGDGRPDRRLVYGPQGNVVRMEMLPPP